MTGSPVVVSLPEDCRANRRAVKTLKAPKAQNAVAESTLAPPERNQAGNELSDAAKTSSTGIVPISAVAGNFPAMTVPVTHVPVAKPHKPSGAGSAIVAAARSSRTSISPSGILDTIGPDLVHRSCRELVTWAMDFLLFPHKPTETTAQLPGWYLRRTDAFQPCVSVPHGSRVAT